MNPDDIVQIGPLAMALDRLVAVALFLAFLGGIELVTRRFGTVAQQHAAPRICAITLLAGLAAARAAYVWNHRDSFALEPMAALYVWLGGWTWSAGVAAAAIVLAVMLRRRRVVVPALGVLAALATVWTAIERQAPRAPILLPADLPLVMAQGGSTTAGNLRAKPLVINLWASWCPPCRREMPMLVAAAERERRATILLANQGEGPDQVQAFIAAQGLSGRAIAFDPHAVLGSLAAAPALPATLFVAADGTIRHIHIGEISRVQLDIAIRNLVD